MVVVGCGAIIPEEHARRAPRCGVVENALQSPGSSRPKSAARVHMKGVHLEGCLEAQAHDDGHPRRGRQYL